MRKKRIRAIYAAFEKEHGRPPARTDHKEGAIGDGLFRSPSECRRARKAYRAARRAGR